MLECYARHAASCCLSDREACADLVPPDGCRLWLAFRAQWPLQSFSVQARIATPRCLTALEQVALRIWLTFRDHPPDVATATEELSLADRYFIEQTLRDLADLGAVVLDPRTLPEDCFLQLAGAVASAYQE